MDYALNQAQLDSSFRQEARLWYNIVVNKLASYYDYPFYRTSVSIPYVSGQRAYSLPADFKSADEAYQYDINGNTSIMIPLVDSYMFQQMSTGNVTGNGSVAYVDTQSNEIVLNSAPNPGTNVGIKLFYFRKPVAIALDGSDDASVPDFQDQTLLMEELKAQAFEFRNDDRYMSKKQEIQKANIDFQRNMYQTDSYSNMNLNAVNFRGTNRRTRGRGFRP